MALFEGALEGLAESGAATGVAIGVGAILLIPGLLPALGTAVRTVAVGAIKTGMVVYDRTAATVRETTGDLVAEARAQIESQRQGSAVESQRQSSAAGPKRAAAEVHS
jgi:hypothetical protein